MPFRRGRVPKEEEAVSPFNLEIWNETPNDQTFVMLADPGTASTVPSGPAPLPLAWLVGVIPGKVGSVVSTGYFYWAEDFAYALGEISAKGAGGFLETVAAPLSAGGDDSVAAGFAGSAGHGAPKLVSITKAGTAGFTMKSDASVPTAAEQAAALVYYAGCWAIDEVDTSGRYAATQARQYLPNLVETLAPAPAYSVIAGPAQTFAGDVLSQAVVQGAYDVDFAGVSVVRLTYTASNMFQPR